MFLLKLSSVEAKPNKCTGAQWNISRPKQNRLVRYELLIHNEMVMITSEDYENICDLYVEGLGPAAIIERLGLSIGKRRIQRIVKERGLTKPHERGGRLDSDSLGTGPLSQIIMQTMVEVRGLDPHLCSQCGRRMVKRCDIHHTKYAGATVYDLVFLCRRCNTSPQNVGLE